MIATFFVDEPSQSWYSVKSCLFFSYCALSADTLRIGFNFSLIRPRAELYKSPLAFLKIIFYTFSEDNVVSDGGVQPRTVVMDFS
jgi:hypothetical protein